MGSIQELLSEKPSSPIFHYADAGAAISIVKYKKIWASKISHLNDPAEHTHAAELLRGELLRRNARSGRIVSALTNVGLYGSALKSESMPGKINLAYRSLELVQEQRIVYVASFSEEGNSLSQWRAYCPDGNGYSLGFEASSFESAPAGGTYVNGEFKGGTFLVKCVYQDDDKQARVAALVDDCVARDDGSDGSAFMMMVDSLVVLASMKHVSFKDEREWRLVTFGGSLELSYRPGRHGIVPYVEIPFGQAGELKLSDVCIGPNSNPDAALESAQMLVIANRNDGQFTNFKVSDTPYRK